MAAFSRHPRVVHESSRPLSCAEQVMYYTAQWTWTRRINRVELYNEPELELCWGPTIFVQQTVIRCRSLWGGVRRFRVIVESLDVWPLRQDWKAVVAVICTCTCSHACVSLSSLIFCLFVVR